MKIKKENNKYRIFPPSTITAGLIGKFENKIDYTQNLNKIRQDEKKILTEIVKISEKNIIFLNQIHTNKIAEVKERPKKNISNFADADAVITSLSNICLVVRTADCVPILLYDQEKKVIAAIHSGWKGTKLNITQKTINMMKDNYHVKPESCEAIILPAISSNNYEVGKEFLEIFPDYTKTKKEKIYLDLPAIIKDQLKNAGLREENITSTNLCTFSKNKDFFSHRKNDKGRNLNFIMLKTNLAFQKI